MNALSNSILFLLYRAGHFRFIRCLRGVQGGSVMRLHIAIAVLPFAAVGYAGAEGSLDDLTPCSAAVRAFASKDEARIREITEYMDSIFQQLDRDHQKSGEQSILNKGLMGTLEAAAHGFCSQHQRSTIANEAADAYRYLRTLIVHTGVDP